LIEFVYNSPNYLLEISEKTYYEIYELKKDYKNNLNSLLNKKCHFIVMSAASIEAHLNWYYYFDKGIDVNESINGKRMNTQDKIKQAPLNDTTKGAVNAIFNLRNQIMHPKYKPRNGFDQYQYNLYIVLLSLGTIIDVCSELLISCPKTLNGRLTLTQRQQELSLKAKNIILKDENNKGINWIEAINTNKVSLPIPSLGHV